MQFIIEHKELILAALLAISELLALSSLKSNSIFQLVVNTIKSLLGKKDQNLLK